MRIKLDKFNPEYIQGLIDEYMSNDNNHLYYQQFVIVADKNGISNMNSYLIPVIISKRHSRYTYKNLDVQVIQYNDVPVQGSYFVAIKGELRALRFMTGPNFK